MNFRATIAYFAYGSNLCPKQMSARCPGAAVLGPAKLMDHRLVFPRFSQRWGGGSAGLTRAAGRHVEGVVYRVEDHHLLRLDEFEGVAVGRHRRTNAQVHLSGGESMDALIYEAIVESGGPFEPTHDYVLTMLSGARSHGLTEDWVAYLESLLASNE